MTTRWPTVLVLASGRGERFRASGGTVHKLQAELQGKPVLQHTLDAVRASGLPWHLEDRGHPGMGDSIAAAVRATPAAVGWLVLPADLPLIRPETLRRVAQAVLDGHAVVVPVTAGPEHPRQTGHPVGFGADCGGALSALRGERGAAPVVRAHRVYEVEVDDPGILTDIDTLDDLRRLQQRAAGDQRR